jgi:hypothetical protein
MKGKQSKMKKGQLKEKKTYREQTSNINFGRGWGCEN